MSVLSVGSHGPHSPYSCMMEWLSVNRLGYQPIRKTDQPREITGSIASIVMAINDSIVSDQVRDRLLGYADRILTCAPLDAVQSDEYDSYYRSIYRSIKRVARANRLRPEAQSDLDLLDLLVEALDAYDQVTGTNWKDRPLPEIPPVVEQVIAAPKYVATTGDKVQLWIGDAMIGEIPASTISLFTTVPVA